MTFRSKLTALFAVALILTPDAFAGDDPAMAIAAGSPRQVGTPIAAQVDAGYAAGDDAALQGGLGAVHGLIRRQVLAGDYADLPPQDAPGGPEFGFSVAIDGDWLAVGAPGTIWTAPVHGTAAHGAVFVFRRDNGSYVLHQRLLSTGSAAAGRCGHAVALSFPHLVRGCPEDSIPGVSDRSGSVGHFWYDPGSDRFQPGGGQGAAQTDARTGAAVALSRNYLAYAEPTAGGGPGRVVVMRRNADTDRFFGAGSVQEAALTPGPDVSGFGWSLALREPGALVVGEPGNVRLAIGAPYTVYAGNIRPRGSAFVYQRALGAANWMLNATVRPTPEGSAAAAWGWFGAAVAMNRNQLLVGAPDNRWAGMQTLPGSGTAHRYVLTESLGAWSWQHQEDTGPVNLPDGLDNGLRFGAALALGFDNLIAVGAPGTPSVGGGRPEVGLAEIRRFPAGDWGLHQYWGELRPAGNTPLHNNAAFGTGLAFDVPDRILVVGVPGHRILGQPTSPRGQVWLYVEDRIFGNGFQ